MQALGVAYSTMQRYDDAMKSLQDSLEIKRRLGMKKGIAGSEFKWIPAPPLAGSRTFAGMTK